MAGKKKPTIWLAEVIGKGDKEDDKYSRGKLARFAMAYYRDQMDLHDWLLERAEEQEVLDETESTESLSDEDEYEVLQQIIVLLAKEIEDGKFKQLFFGKE